MTKIFRNIRKQLASENKVMVYLRYAIGEIFLVVIGILIALQINNWNESRKQNIAETEFIEGVKKDLTQGKLYIELVLKQMEPSIDAFNLLNNRELSKTHNKDINFIESLLQIYFSPGNVHFIRFPALINRHYLVMNSTTIKVKRSLVQL